MAQQPTGTPAVERLGRYEVLGEIASGGMATVFLGRLVGSKGFQRLVAIKRLHPHLECEEEFVSMFLDEARLAARIRHPNCVATLDVEDQEGLYIVMEYIEGDRLLGLLRHAARSGERIPVPVVLRIGLDTLAGLHAAHELCDDDGQPFGLVHRDVSPQNILIGVDGVTRLTDFGIAKASARLTVTRDGQLKGKIAYMAPEQTKRQEIDRRVDVFAMGIILWEMLTSKKLFSGESDVEILNQLLFEPIPRLKDAAPGLPAALEGAVMKALERDPARRYASASEFAVALERASKIVGGPANARVVADYVKRVSADKLARDRARMQTGTTSGDTGPNASNSGVKRRMTGDHAAFGGKHPDSSPDAGAGARRGGVPKQTMMGLGAPPAGVTLPSRPSARSTSGALPAVVGAPSKPSVNVGPALVDDDEDVPTSTVDRERGILNDLLEPAVDPVTAAPQSANASDSFEQTTIDPGAFGARAHPEDHLEATTAMSPEASPARPRQPSGSKLPAVDAPRARQISQTALLAAPAAPPSNATHLGPSVHTSTASFNVPVASRPAKRGGLVIAAGAAVLVAAGLGVTFAVTTRRPRADQSAASANARAASLPVMQPAAVPPVQQAGAVQPAGGPAVQPAGGLAQQGAAAADAGVVEQATEQPAVGAQPRAAEAPQRPAGPRANAGARPAAGPRPAGGAQRPQPGGRRNAREDDPFGSDNPYQR